MERYFQSLARFMLLLLAISFVLPYVGNYLNHVVIYANDGAMPVLGDTEPYESGKDKWIPMTRSTHLNWASDIIPIGSAMLSIGDILLIGGRYLRKASFPFCMVAMIYTLVLVRFHIKKRLPT